MLHVLVVRIGFIYHTLKHIVFHVLNSVLSVVMHMIVQYAPLDIIQMNFQYVYLTLFLIVITLLIYQILVLYAKMGIIFLRILLSVFHA